MKTLITTIAVCLVGGLLINYLGAKEPIVKEPVVQRAKPEEIKELTHAHNKFGFKLLKELHTEGENVFISPSSISTAFGMLHNGTVDQVKQEFEDVFGWGGFNPDTFNSANKELISGLLSQDKKSILKIANSIWIRQDFDVETAFKVNNIKFFDSEVNNVPFNAQTVRRVNDWCTEKTHGKIKEMIQAFNPDSALLLLNAVYFKGTWTKPFDKRDTSPWDFTLSDNSKVKVPLMYKNDYLDYQETDEYQAVRLPFGKGETAMTFILPKKGLGKFQKTLTDSKFQEIQSKFNSRKIKLFVPRFKIEYKGKLKNPLQKMGLRKSFRLSSGFAKINRKEVLGISRVIHKTFLEVKEEGAEAAAVTAIGGANSVSMNPDPVLRINRPFLCTITNVKTGNVIFVGSVYNPLK